MLVATAAAVVQENSTTAYDLWPRVAQARWARPAIDNDQVEVAVWIVVDGLCVILEKPLRLAVRAVDRWRWGSGRRDVENNAVGCPEILEPARHDLVPSWIVLNGHQFTGTRSQEEGRAAGSPLKDPFVPVGQEVF